MEIGLIVSIIIAVLGWGIAIWQMVLNRRWQKRDALIQRKYDIYSRFMIKVDEAYNEYTKSPEIFTGDLVSGFLTASMSGDEDEIHESIAKINKGLIDFIWSSIKPIQTLSSEISSLRLVASEELLSMIDELHDVVMDIVPKFEEGLSKIDINDKDSYNLILQLREEKHFEDFEAIKEKIENQMRNEIHSN